MKTARTSKKQSASALLKKEREEKRKAREKAQLAKEQKRVLKEQERLRKEKEKASEAAAAMKVASLIKKLKIEDSYDSISLAARKDVQLLESFLSNEDYVESICVQFYKGKEFIRLEHKDNEYVIRVDDIIYFFDRDDCTAINFGRVYNSWLNTSKKTPWGCLKKDKKKRAVKQ